ncbi:VOC family protein [Corynebacterium pseudokroppenstedtii]|uniref:VOC family protein n=1 Tax=Corynebacterium pseudokroppenstedtii TaxID=2804917 RepID=UPI003079E3F5
MSMSPDREIYPMPMFATFAVEDFERSERFYQAAGFITLARVPGANPGGEPNVVHLRRLRHQDILLVRAVAAGSARPNPDVSSLSIAVHGEDIEALQQSLVAREEDSPLVSISDVEDTPWFTRDLHVIDPDGHHIVFTQQQMQDFGEATKWATTFDPGE